MNDDLNACAALVERADPARFRAAMAAPVAARATLFPLYAFNAEVARAPWVTAEPMIAEMRLQWWRDALDEIATGAQVRRHEVVTPLSGALDAEGARLLDGLIVARRADLETTPFAQDAALWTYLDATSGTLLWVASRALGAGAGTEGAVRMAGQAQGLANWLRAVPALEAAGKRPLPDGRATAIADLAETGLQKLRGARAARGALPLPALLAVAGAGRVLRRVAGEPGLVASDGLAEAGVRERLALPFAALTGRW